MGHTFESDPHRGVGIFGPMSPVAVTTGSSGSVWRQLVGIDVRSLAALRIGLAAVLIYDLLARLRDLEAFYSDTGVLPRVGLLGWKEDAFNFSIHFMSGIWWVQGLLFLVTLVAAVALLVGRHTRVATFLCWLMVASLHVRNPLVLHGGDMLLRLLLFWGMFVPWGRAASWDSRLQPAISRDPWVVNVGTLALKLQLCGMYWFSAALKWHPVWVEEGTAVAMALRLDQLVTPLGRFLTQWPDLLQAATFATMVLETVGPVLVFLPVLTPILQMFAVVLFAGFHLLGLAPALYLGIFPFVCAVGWCMFIPARFWESWWPRCRGVALGGRLRRISFVLGERGASWCGSRSSLHQESGFLRKAAGWAAQGLAFALLVYVGLWNLRTVNFERWESLLPRSANGVGDFLRLGQIWNLFAPFPATEDGWFVFEGQLVNGDVVDARSDPSDPESVTFDKPYNPSRALGNERWKKYLMNFDDPQNGVHRRLFGEYLCRTWNRSVQGEDRLASIGMYVMRERTLPTGEEEEPIQGRLWNQICVLPD